MNASVAAAIASDTTDIALSSVSTRSSMRACPMELPVSAIVSIFWPCSVRTKNRTSARNPATQAAPSTSSQPAGTTLSRARMNRR